MKEILLISGLGIAVLLLEILKWQKLILPVIITGLAAIIGFSVWHFNYQENVYNMLFLDRTARIMIILLATLGIFWFLLARKFIANISHISDYASLILFSMVGGFILVSYINMTMLFLGVEILSIPVYVLAGSEKRNLASNESSFKYFLMGAFASSFLLMGIAFLYGATGSFDIRTIGVAPLSGLSISGHLMVLGLLLIMFALAFKVSAVPFHFWTPDVYMGAPTAVTAYMATIVKVAALAAFFRLFGVAFGLFHTLYASVALVIAVLTVVVGNLLAVSQDNTKRMLAYSGIGHAGFVLLGLAIQQNISTPVVLYYLIAYSVSGIAAFGVLNVVTTRDNEDVSAFNGLAKRNPLLAVTMALALLSMAGIPPLSGFFAKYFILINVLLSAHVWIAVIAIIASLIGVYYYFRIIIAIFFGQGENEEKIDIDWLGRLALLVLCLLIIGLGIYPEFIFSAIN